MLAKLTRDFHHKPELTRFLPATVCWTAEGPQLTAISWRGSGDMPSLTRANAFLVAEAGRMEWKAGELMRVLLK